MFEYEYQQICFSGKLYQKDQIIYSVCVSDILSFFYLLKNLFTRYIHILGT